MKEFSEMNPQPIKFKKKEDYHTQTLRKAVANGMFPEHDFSEYDWKDGLLYTIVSNVNTEGTISCYMIQVGDIIDTYPCSKYLIDTKVVVKSKTVID